MMFMFIFLNIEVCVFGQKWQTLFNQKRLTASPPNMLHCLTVKHTCMHYSSDSLQKTPNVIAAVPYSICMLLYCIQLHKITYFRRRGFAAGGILNIKAYSVVYQPFRNIGGRFWRDQRSFDTLQTCAHTAIQKHIHVPSDSLMSRRLMIQPPVTGLVQL